MQRLKTVFADKHGLHSRIDTYLRHSSVLKVGIVPIQGHHRSNSLLNALIDDPIEKTPWSKALAERPLTKDVLVTQSSNFEYVETQNSLVVYPVPFKGDAIEYLEVNSLEDSWDHVKHCHLHLYVTDRLGSHAPESRFPFLTVLDSQSAFEEQIPDLKSCEYRGELLHINSQKALDANSALQSSPSNSSTYTNLWKLSKIDELKALFQSSSVYEALKASIVRSCQEQISDLSSEANADSQSLAEAAKLRTEWSQGAHRELQGSLLPRIHSALFHDLAFYKLYARTDDIEPVLTQILDHGLPRSEGQLQYLKGRLGSNFEAASAADPSVRLGLESATLSLQNSALKSVLTSLLGIQLPLIGLSFMGVFFGGFDWYSMGALASLGIVSGLKKLQNDWLKEAQSYEGKVEAAALNYIEDSQQTLFRIKEEGRFEADSKRLVKESALKAALEENI